MNADQKAARDRAVQTLTHYAGLLMGRTGDADDSPARTVMCEELERFVDDVIVAAVIASRPAAKTEHEAAVERLRDE